MSKALARGSKKSVVDDCFSGPTLFKFVKKKIGSLLKYEIKLMCSNKVQSVLHSTSSCSNLKKFNWNNIMDELKANAPILLHNILTSCIPSKNANFQATICVCSSLIFYSHFRQMNLVQKIISLILYAGCARI